MVEKGRLLNDSEREEVMKLKHDDITLDLMKSYFAYRGNPAKRRFNPFDIINLKSNEFYNKEQTSTTIGRIIFNKVILDEDILEIIGFQNYVFTKKSYGKLDEKIVKLAIEEKITVERVFKYFDDLNWFSYSTVYFLAPSLNSEMYIVPTEVKKRKKELEKLYSDAIINNDVIKIAEIEDELLKIAKEIRKSESGYQIYNSGARGSFGNNYKNTVVMRGGVTNFAKPNEFNISMSSLVDGVKKDEIDIYANILTAGTYARAKNTEKGGYMGKELQSAFQHIMLDEPESDCGTKQYLKIDFDNNTKNFYKFRYILEGSKEIELTDENIDKYIGKSLKMRSPLYCTGDKICNKCAGNLFYKLGISNAGLLCNKQGTSLMQYSMKQFHNATIKVTEVDFEKYLNKA